MTIKTQSPRVGATVIWLGRTTIKQEHDHLFVDGNRYTVKYVHPSNGSVVLVGDNPYATIKASENEYSTKN